MLCIIYNWEPNRKELPKKNEIMNFMLIHIAWSQICNGKSAHKQTSHNQTMTRTRTRKTEFSVESVLRNLGQQLTLQRSPSNAFLDSVGNDHTYVYIHKNGCRILVPVWSKCTEVCEIHRFCDSIYEVLARFLGRTCATSVCCRWSDVISFVDVGWIAEHVVQGRGAAEVSRICHLGRWQRLIQSNVST